MAETSLLFDQVERNFDYVPIFIMTFRVPGFLGSGVRSQETEHEVQQKGLA
jgi:hypothetical protein